MFPGIGGMNPAKMKAMMRQLGIHQEDIEAEKVEIFKKDGGKIVIEEPSVQKIKMQGQVSYQISGEEREEIEKFSEEDVKIVMEKAGKGEEEAKKALEETNGDIAEAILKLSE